MHKRLLIILAVKCSEILSFKHVFFICETDGSNRSKTPYKPKLKFSPEMNTLVNNDTVT